MHRAYYPLVFIYKKKERKETAKQRSDQKVIFYKFKFDCFLVVKSNLR